MRMMLLMSSVYKWCITMYELQGRCDGDLAHMYFPRLHVVLMKCNCCLLTLRIDLRAVWGIAELCSSTSTRISLGPPRPRQALHTLCRQLTRPHLISSPPLSSAAM